MSLALEREKELPDIPIDTNPSEAVVVDEGLGSIPPANTNKALPPIKAEKTLSEEEISRLHELWNGAGLSARAHRRGRRGQDPLPHRIPAPISIPKPDNIPLTSLGRPAGLSMTSTTAPETAARKRWGFLSARRSSETQEEEKKAPNALEVLREMAQGRLKKKLRYAKSAPDLGNQAAPLRRGVKFQHPVSTPVKATPKNMGASSARNITPPRGSAIPEAVLQQGDMDENAIYFTIGPNWRASQGSVQFEPITPIPDSPTSLGRPDSPLLHRPHSLHQLAQRAAATLTARDFPKTYPGDPIDELHAYLEL
ncbi:hypothetical protein JVT61DRAFT_11032 [Boletus reticuloceps]|uniref:Uncharacterized protein n=1 Tax=Boletus reticuloceps TaxID=495285 RepID=A0A8I3A512_9AGAM|nr:hypothetical protein JVT61DRAFT_11032 [Boletus reticuloceps]